MGDTIPISLADAVIGELQNSFMAQPPRVVVLGIPHRITQRGVWRHEQTGPSPGGAQFVEQPENTRARVLRGNKPRP